jgi:hypothetical protein
LSKEKYQIPRKSDFICLSILQHDLKCFDSDLSKPGKDTEGLIFKLRNSRNVFVSLHNLKDSMNRIRIDGNAKFVSETRLLRKELKFISHIRNKGVGHLDRSLLERAAQWAPQIFQEKSKDFDEYITFECYRAVIESSINSYLNEDGEQKIFDTEIDFLYPPNADQFFEFLSGIVKNSIEWLNKALEIIRSEIHFHTDDQIGELGAIAGKTNFDLDENSVLLFSEDDVRSSILCAIEKMREMGTDEKIISFMENEFLK